jgi:diguanylate cyclase (GGDEF)-like protein
MSPPSVIEQPHRGELRSPKRLDGAMRTTMPRELADSVPASTRRAGGTRLLASSRGRWAPIACAILVVGLGLSLGGALLWRSSVRSREHQEFQTNATDVSETAETLLRGDADLVTTLRGVLTMQPNMSATRFDQWFAELHGKERQVGGLGTTVVEVVPARGLAAFQARRAADPAFREFVGGTIAPVAPSGRAVYCLLSAGGTVTPYTREVGQLVQGDWCNPATPIGGYQDGGILQASLLQSITDSGQFLVYPVAVQGVSTLFIEAAFYNRGAPLRTVAERRAAVAGWVGSSFEITTLIQQALGDHRGLSLALYHRNPGQPEKLIGKAGAAASAGAFSHESTLQIDGIWRALVRGSAVTGGLSPSLQGLVVFAVGAIISLLLAALVLVLTRAREHALGMVQEKTGQLRHQALHDSLTGLPNRVLALDRAEQMLARARRQHLPVSALYLDIDGFKQVNDTFGHAAGDALLRTVASRLESVIRDGDTAARLGGDEFVILLDGAAVDIDPELVAERLRDVLRQPYELNEGIGRELTVTASIGIAVGVRESADELLRDADLALYEAKAAGKDSYAMFESCMQSAAQERLALELDLAKALERSELYLLYQPTFDLRSERIVGVEALIRWRHPTRGVVSPEAFIPIAEESGLIVPIGRWVLEEASRQAAIWRRCGHAIGVAVNISARQLDDDSLIEDVRRTLHDSGLVPGALTLEVTETALMRDTEATARRLVQLKQLGVLIAIDDFGTGYSSLAYLRQFPADVLKIDRSFVSGIASSDESAALIHTLVALGRALHIETLAEGIEDRAQLHALQREHCDHGQGFLFSRPLDVDALEQFLDAASTPHHGASHTLEAASA